MSSSQLVENEEIIGTLIEGNDRIMSALEMYDQLSTPDSKADGDDASAVASGLAAVQISTQPSEISRLQDKQRAAVERAKSFRGREDNPHLHPDLQDLSFGSIRGSSSNLPAPLEPSTSALYDDEDESNDRRGSLSDFSDYESSDEETHNATSSKGRRAYVNVSDDSDDGAAVGVTKVEDDPFADPFADEVAIGPSKKW